MRKYNSLLPPAAADLSNSCCLFIHNATLAENFTPAHRGTKREENIGPNK